MEIYALPIKMLREEAIEIATQGKGSILRKLFLLNKKVEEVRIHYIEFKLINLEIKNKNKHNNIKILINGSTGSGSLVQDMPVAEQIEIIDENSIQCCDKDDKMIRLKAIKMAMRISHRFMGGIPEIKISKIESIFRPYWVVFFDKVQENKKVKYLPIEADGFSINRGF
ncbi:hypothetical protein [Tepidibacter hydrothermalis]|uniref:Uncharacterized protein n=1 Tax=Tepidibacter hydrothermalis TaxID=3036126 RepID=A0ABY8EH82_9FIRM|nr:hypothetical protein [Tepidibacter hydrothermalis]WFD12294.1 hypothetical protein P4S50_09460 [Tepidibacter hydrothermalis]